MTLRTLALFLSFSFAACNRTSTPPGPPDAPQTPSAAWFGGAPPPTALPTADAPPDGGVVSSASSSTFVKTQDSDEWVRQTFKLQPSYSRVLVVTTGAPVQKLSVAKLDLNAAGAATDIASSGTFRTIQEAVDAAKGGDLVAVMPGKYAGFYIGDRSDLGDGKYLHVRAIGKPGEVVIDSPQTRDPKWMIYLVAAHHVVVEGFSIAGKATPGEAPAGPRAGVMIAGGFADTGKLAHHIAVTNVFAHNMASWGLHAVDSHTVLVQDSVFALSGREHGAYVSDGSDNYVIRRNVFFGNYAGGLQCNLDPEASLEKLAEHKDMRGQPKDDKSRAYATAILAAGVKRFGENQFPDGRGINFIIERNVMNQNGKLGGGALNLAAMSESLIQNNLIYGNFAHGIAQWDNRNPYDEAAREPGPQKPEDATVERLPIFGCRNNLFRNNTVLMDKRGRSALQAANGSFGTRAFNNVLINDSEPSIEIFGTALLRFEAGVNVINGVGYEGVTPDLRKIATALPDAPPTVRGVTRAAAAGSFARYGEEPWIVIEGSWWRLNPARPDFHPKPGGMFAGKGDKKELAPIDLDGQARAGADIGAFAAR